MSGSVGESLREAFVEEFPHGDSLFAELTIEEMEGYSRKNYDYAAGGDPNGNFYRVAAICALYPGLKLSDPRVVSMLYSLKQLDAVLWSLSRGFEGEVEGIDERLFDIHVYAKITRIINRRMATAESGVGDIHKFVCNAHCPDGSVSRYEGDE